jgi:hypothetical protein
MFAFVAFLLAVSPVAGLLRHGVVGEDMRFVELSAAPDAALASVVSGSFDEDVLKTGWATLRVASSGAYSNEQQARAAGVFEGALTADLIDAYVAANCPAGTPTAQLQLDKKAYAFVVKQFAWVRATALKNANASDFWAQIHLQMVQMEGIAAGYLQDNPLASNPITALDVYLLSGSDSVEDIMTGVQFNAAPLKKPFVNEKAVGAHCSAIVRFTGTDLFTAHATWTGFDQMLRIMKEYDFRFTRNDGSPVPGSLIQFSSYPGSIWSSDDFYQIGTGAPMNLAVWETTSSVYNTTLWQALSTSTVLTFMRVQAANRLATSGPNWAQWFKMFHSGTYTNAWMIVDYGLFRARADPATLDANTAYMIEELPGLTAEGDMTDFINTAGYFASFNVWFFQETYVASATPYMVEKHGPWFSFDGCPRNLIFAREAPKTQTLSDVQRLMRFNEWNTDPLSSFPQRSPANTIASRKDLAPTNVSYTIEYIRPECDGAIDAKVTSDGLMQAAQFTAVAGPTWGGKNNLPPFDWSAAAPICQKVLHNGQPTLFNYNYVGFF